MLIIIYGYGFTMCWDWNRRYLLRYAIRYREIWYKWISLRVYVL